MQAGGCGLGQRREVKGVRNCFRRRKQTTQHSGWDDVERWRWSQRLGLRLLQLQPCVLMLLQGEDWHWRRVSMRLREELLEGRIEGR